MIAGALLLAVVQGALGSVEGWLRAPEVRTAESVVYLVAEDSSAAIAPEHALIDQRDLRFVPRVVVVPPGSVVEFLNSDPILHNVFSPPKPGPGFNLGVYPPGEKRTHVYEEAGALVMLCHIHPEMLAYVVVVPSTLHGVADADGRFRIDSVPAGRYRLNVWHRRLSFPGKEIELLPGANLHLDLLLSPSHSDRKERHR